MHTVANCLDNNIILPADDEKIDGMTCSELNQLAGGAHYKVCTILFCIFFDIVDFFNFVDHQKKFLELNWAYVPNHI